MSDHDWTFENLSAYLAGGLNANERQRVDQHVAVCAECANGLQQSREMEQMMDSLFTTTRPDANLEARALAKLRQARLRRASIYRFAAAAAAVLVLGLVGAAVQAVALGDMGLPGDNPAVSQNNLRVAAIPMDAHAREDFHVADVDPAAVDMNEAISFKTGRFDRKAKVLDKADSMALEDLKDIAGKKTLGGEVVRGYGGRTGATRGLVPHGGGGSSEDKKLVDGGKTALHLHLGFSDNYAWGLQTARSNEVDARLGSKKPSDALVKTDPDKHFWSDKEYFKEEQGKKASKSDKAPEEPKAPAPVPTPAKTEPVADLTFTTVGQKIGHVAVSGPKQPPPPPEPAVDSRKIIYTGEMEFEIDSFDAGIAKVKELIASVNKTIKKGPGAFLLTEDRTKQPNGKTRGSIVVRIPPGDPFDKFIADLRSELGKFGELKMQHLGSQDVTKQYTDTESELKAARLVEARLIEIIQKKQGDIKDLVAAENVLGTWRTKIEKMEGEIRYYNNQVALSTLTITLTEKDIGTPASLVVTEKVTMRVEVDEVKKALDGALEAVRAVKGRIIRSETTQHKAGQFEATLDAEVPPAQKEPFGKAIAALGLVTENKSTQKTQAEGGTGKPGKLDPRVNDVVFEIKLNNIVNIKPRRSVAIDLATADVQEAYKKLKAELAQIAKAQIRTDNLNEQDKVQVTAELDFNVPADKKEAFDDFLAKLGKTLKKTSMQAPITEIATEQKFGYTLRLFSPASIQPREVVTLKMEVKDVDKRLAELKDAAIAGKGRVADANVVRHENGQVTATLVLVVPLAVQDLIVMKVKETGNLLGQQAERNPNVPENELTTARIDIKLHGVFAGKEPREKVNLSVEVPDVDQKAADVKETVKAGKGRVADEKTNRQPNGQVTATLVFEVPLADLDRLVKQFKDAGNVVSYQTTRNSSVPDNDLATAQITLTLAGKGPIVDSDSGPGYMIRKGLNVSFYVFAYCLIAIVAGLSALVPLGALIYGVFKGMRWMWPGEKVETKPT